MKAKLRNKLETLVKVYKLSKEILKEEHLRASIQKKRLFVEEAKRFLTTYKTVIILDNTGTPSKLYRYMKQRYSNIFYIKMIKNTILIRAMKELGMPNVDEFAKYLKGSNMILFTNLNSFEAKLILDKILVPYRIKPGEKIEHEVIVPPMRTELKPGPVMSILGKLKVPIQVKEGVIWIARESTIARPGDIATPELISVFEKLGIEPKLLKPKIKVAYEKGLIILPEQLVVDVEGVKKQLLECMKTVISFAVELVIPEPSVLKLAIARAYTKACNLASELGIVTRETAMLVFSVALKRALALVSVLTSKIPEFASIIPQGVQQQAITGEKKVETKPEEEKKEKEKETSEEQLAEGLAALFG